MGAGGQRHNAAALRPEDRPGTLWVRLGGPRDRSWTDIEKKVACPHPCSIPGPSARSESLYRLSSSEVVLQGIISTVFIVTG
jgi:hypothetical protein